MLRLAPRFDRAHGRCNGLSECGWNCRNQKISGSSLVITEQKFIILRPNNW